MPEFTQHFQLTFGSAFPLYQTAPNFWLSQIQHIILLNNGYCCTGGEAESLQKRKKER